MASEPIDRRRMLFQSALSFLVLVLALFLPAGTWAWFRGWLFVMVLFGSSLIALLYLRRANPDVIAGRVNRQRWPRRWDLILGVMMLTAMLAMLVVSGLDDGRYHASHLSWWVCALGYGLMLIGLIGVTWAEAVNKFFEPSVRIQTDRGHRVIDTGPYAFLRHPGYAFGSLFMVGTPVALGSLWALIPAGLLLLLLAMRTVWEDKTLQAELPGYREYAQRVRYRLLPGVW